MENNFNKAKEEDFKKDQLPEPCHDMEFDPYVEDSSEVVFDSALYNDSFTSID